MVHTTKDTPKSVLFTQIEEKITDMGFTIAGKDDQRPWGGFFVIDENQAIKFIDTFFPHLDIEDFRGFARLSPKILLVAPGKRLSWQYHHRRSEIWKVIEGNTSIVTSDTNQETPARPLKQGDIVRLRQGERHRLIGTDEWGIVAEIWQHTDPSHPSDENDIIRLDDDFGR